MQFQKRCLFGVSLVCCFCMMLALFSSTAFAAEADDPIIFAELCGWELADGERKNVTLDGDDFRTTIKVTNTTTVDSLVQSFNRSLSNYGFIFSYDRASGQFVTVKEKDGSKVDFTLSSNGEALSFKPSSPTPPASSGSTTMPQLLSTITEVFATSAEWIAAVSNVIVSSPILLLIVVISFIGTGVLLFKRFLNL